jgi:hypothetical protein
LSRTGSALARLEGGGLVRMRDGRWHAWRGGGGCEGRRGKRLSRSRCRRRRGGRRAKGREAKGRRRGRKRRWTRMRSQSLGIQSVKLAHRTPQVLLTCARAWRSRPSCGNSASAVESATANSDSPSQPPPPPERERWDVDCCSAVESSRELMPVVILSNATGRGGGGPTGSALSSSSS